MANDYYDRLSEMNPGELADGLAMEAEFDAISRGFSKLPAPHIGGQGFNGPVRIGDAVNSDEAVSKGQLDTAIGKAKLLAIATYGNLNATAWSSLPSGSYLLFGTGAQLTNFPVTLTAGATYYVSVQHTIGDIANNVYQDVIAFHSVDDPNHVDRGRLMSRVGSSLVTAPWRSSAFKVGGVSALESLVPTADRMPYYSGSNSAALAVLTSFARTLLDDPNDSAARATLGAYGKDNIVGSVSQIAGVPSGAIIESGSNANGSYVKFADGTVHMDIYKAGLTTAITQATGGVFVTPSSGPTAIPLPIALISTFNVTVNAHQLRTSSVWVTACGPVDTVSLSIFFGSSVSVTYTDMSLRVGVNGRWY